MKLLFLLTFAMTSIVHADSFLHPEESDFNKMAFERTKALCQGAKDEDQIPKTEIQYLKMSAFLLEGVKNGAFIWRAESFKLTPDTKDFVNSDGFKAGLYSCFGRDEQKQNLFKNAIYAEDIVGHLVGYSIWLVPVSRFARFLSRTRFVTAHPQVFSRATGILSNAGKIGLVAMAGYMAYGIHQQNELQATAHETVKEANEQMGDAAELTRDSTRDFLEGLLSSYRAELAQGTSDRDHEASLRRRIAFLEDKLKEKNRD